MEVSTPNILFNYVKARADVQIPAFPTPSWSPMFNRCSSLSQAMTRYLALSISRTSAEEGSARRCCRLRSLLDLMDSTVRYLGVDIEDALSLSEGIDLQSLRRPAPSVPVGPEPPFTAEVDSAPLSPQADIGSAQRTAARPTSPLLEY